MSFNSKPSYGRRLMPAVLDELARTSPDRLYAAIPKTADVTDGFRDISVADMARCVDFMAQWIENLYGRSQDFETISYIGIPDLRGAAIFQAALLLPSPRNPPSTNASLMEQTRSTKLLHAAEVKPIVRHLSDIVPFLHVATIPSFDEMVTSSPGRYPFSKLFDECRDDPVVVLHSSGSTGLPKPITMTHGSFAVLDNEHNLRDVPGRRKRDWSMWTFRGEARVYTVFPFFHLAGFLSLTLQTIFMNASPVLGPPHMIPDSALLKLVMQHQKLRSMFLPPAVIEGLLHEPNGIDAFKRLDFLVYSGAPFSPAIGDRLSKVVEIISPFGSTEVYPQPELAPTSPEDWAYHEFNPNVKHEMELYDSTEGTYELVILVDETTKDFAAAYHNLPGIAEFHTKDLFVQHPRKPRLFKYYGRRDDIIVLANGEKFNPVPFEVNLQNHPLLKGAFVIGTGRRQAALLVEPKEPLDEAGRQSLLEALWPLVVSSNQLIPGQGRIQKSRMLCGLPEKPFTRTGKGTIMRKLTEETYNEEIKNLYLNESSQFKRHIANLVPDLQPTLYELSNVITFCRGIMSIAFPVGTKIDGDEDFVTHGLDSEQTVEIVSNLKRYIRSRTNKSVDWISPRTLFQHSTVNSLSSILLNFLNNSSIPREDLKLSRRQPIEEIVAEYTEGLSEVQRTTNPSQRSHRGASGTVVAIIGSTGYLGSHMVVAFIKDPKISRIYCLNRSPDARAKQETLLQELGVGSLEKLDFMTIDLEGKSLGLTQEAKEKILNEVDVIVLNAWRSNFVLPLQSFSPFLKATQELIQLATASTKMHIIFVSSLAAVGAMARKANVPEALVQDPLAAFNNGYAQSKLAAERILAIGSERCGVPVTVVRVTQIGGPIPSLPGGGGRWAEQGWITAIVKTSKSICLIPSDGPLVDWLPVNTVADLLRREVVTDTARHNDRGVRFLNLLHPHPQPWKIFVEVLRASLGVERTTPMKEWIQKVRDVYGADDGVTGSKLPAVPLLDYYEEEYVGSGVATYDTVLAAENSPVNVPALEEETLRSWLSGWEL
ncbi:hypothetical protein FHL15_011268 [Xylaria flabelliformis]|uniref:Carrier domain-containing protein n=1 Tax=Xylaria flabelliformis TaxID=2512241 RepID=A0A553HIR0_9PEZI|nr:hypothetical protein FHL15_011268 [Xylaria flabelliformis]